MSVRAIVEEATGQLGRIRDAVNDRERGLAKEIALVHEAHRERARNLVHYWAFKECIAPGLREQLQLLGLDPLDEIEWDVLGRVDRVLRRLSGMDGAGGPSIGDPDGKHTNGRALLRSNTDALFGQSRTGRDVRIMVTVDSESANDPDVIGTLSAEGADCFRLNCARDNRESWHRLIELVRHDRLQGKRSLIFMDLGGSKLRVSSCAGGTRSIRLRVGDTLFISRSIFPSLPPGVGGNEPSRLEIAVSDPAALAGVLPGHQIWFDDGKIGGIVRERAEKALRVEITYAKEGGRKLRLERGLNLPDTPLRLPALTRKDLDDLPFAATHADFVALSFIRTPADVHEFRAALTALPEARPAMVIKLETREALEHLPDLMLAAMRNEKVAILLARGDLAVECGMLEMPTIQRNVTRYCAAASLPLFWATGVMERASRTGEPTRAEVTDAAEAARAQCVMLNKGPNTIRALRLLGELLTRRSEDK